MIDGILLRRAESEDAWAMGVIETACWRVGYAGCFPNLYWKGWTSRSERRDGSGFSDVPAVKHGLLRIWKVEFWASRHSIRFGSRAHCSEISPDDLMFRWLSCGTISRATVWVRFARLLWTVLLWPNAMPAICHERMPRLAVRRNWNTNLSRNG